MDTPIEPQSTLRILFLGDVVGEPGRKAVGFALPKLKEQFEIDFKNLLMKPIHSLVRMAPWENERFAVKRTDQHPHFRQFKQPGPRCDQQPNPPLDRSHVLIGSVEEKGLTLIPLQLYFRNGFAKVQIGLAKGRHLYDKREKLKRETQLREAKRAMEEAR